ncbi:hypothetical protein BGC31_06145 [Komagataeibacter xylinus]|nr:hypothetical protein BFX83_16570 [Komagataeibacter xylinus]RFP05435.1 hypothetical protein BGC31_06145 [Komagataeibacter xylinus]
MSSISHAGHGAPGIPPMMRRAPDDPGEQGRPLSLFHGVTLVAVLPAGGGKLPDETDFTPEGQDGCGIRGRRMG